MDKATLNTIANEASKGNFQFGASVYKGMYEPIIPKIESNDHEFLKLAIAKGAVMLDGAKNGYTSVNVKNVYFTPSVEGISGIVVDEVVYNGGIIDPIDLPITIPNIEGDSLYFTLDALPYKLTLAFVQLKNDEPYPVAKISCNDMLLDVEETIEVSVEHNLPHIKISDIEPGVNFIGAYWDGVGTEEHLISNELEFYLPLSRSLINQSTVVFFFEN